MPDLRERRETDLVSYQHLTVEPDGAFTTITLNRPEKRNALALDVMIELTQAFRDVAATDAIVVSVGETVLEGHRKDTPVAPRYDVVYLRDELGWYYRYSHLHTIGRARYVPASDEEVLEETLEGVSEHFQRNAPATLEVVRFIHRPHPATAEQPPNAVTAEHLPRHRCAGRRGR